MSGFNVAVVGATGAAGGKVLGVMAEKGFPAHKIFALASEKSAGQEIAYRDRVLTVQDLTKFSFKGIQIVFCAAGSDVSREVAKLVAQEGGVSIDKSSAHRMEPDVPLIVPGVNSDNLTSIPERRIIAAPNCSTIQMVKILKPLHDAATVNRVVVATYQAVSGAGKNGLRELEGQARAAFEGVALPPPGTFDRQILGNVIPKIDGFLPSGYTKEEMKMVLETQKIVDPRIKVTATCVRVPVRFGHSESMNVEFDRLISADKAREILRRTPGVVVVDTQDQGSYITPIEVADTDKVGVSRIREDLSRENGLEIWNTADNTRTGAATTAVEIAQLLIDRGMIEPIA